MRPSSQHKALKCQHEQLGANEGSRHVSQGPSMRHWTAAWLSHTDKTDTATCKECSQVACTMPWNNVAPCTAGVLTKWHVLCHDGSDLLVHSVADAQTVRCITCQCDCTDAAKDDKEDSPGCHAAACSQVGQIRARRRAKPG